MSCSRQQPVPHPKFPPSHLIATTQAFYQGLKLRWSASLRFDPGEKHDLPRLKAVWPAGSHHERGLVEDQILNLHCSARNREKPMNFIRAILAASPGAHQRLQRSHGWTWWHGASVFPATVIQDGIFFSEPGILGKPWSGPSGYPSYHPVVMDDLLHSIETHGDLRVSRDFPHFRKPPNLAEL